MEPQHKYARIGRERRFLLDRFPSGVNVARIRCITDRHIDGTTLRLPFLKNVHFSGGTLRRRNGQEQPAQRRRQCLVFSPGTRRNRPER